jgi:PKD repeat protein
LHEEVTSMRQRQGIVGAVAAACVVAATIAGITGVPAASATTSTRSASTTIAGSTTFHGVALATTSLAGVTVGASGLDGTIDWQQSATLSTDFDTDAVRQGRAVDPVDHVTNGPAGTMTINWSLADLQVAFPGFGPFAVGTIGLSASGPCELRYAGTAYVCHLESDTSPILDSDPFPGPYVRARLVTDVTVTPAALATLRTASIAGTPVGTSGLAFGAAPVVDTLTVPCAAAPGDHLSYGLGSVSTTPGLTLQTGLALEVGTSVVNPDFPQSSAEPIVHLPPLASPTFGFAPISALVPMTGRGAVFDLGGVLADDTPVHAEPGGPYSVPEGAALTFDGSGSGGGCTAPTLHWVFSDGNAADGAQVTHAFADDGLFSGTLTATRGAQTATVDFPVTVTDVAPTVDAGADVSGRVGTAVSFLGVATDPSPVDQQSLAYSWDFGDGSPAASTATPTHTYDAGGVYDATLTVCDKDGGCASDVRRVSVTAQQPTVLLYLGDLVGRTGARSDVRAIVVDRKLRPLPGRTVVFTLGTQTVSATTDTRGLAATKLDITQPRGLYALTASWQPSAGDEEYAGSSMTVPFLVLRR